MRRGPLRRVVSRQQDFHSTHEFPDGWINEVLECGHVLKEGIHPELVDLYDDGVNPPKLFRHRHLAARRRCVECAKSRPT